jgi:hypothetical protein
MLGDPGHAAKVARLAVALAVALDWPAHLQAQLHRAATLHDVGKRPLLPALLRRRAPLTPAQRRTSAASPDRRGDGRRRARPGGVRVDPPPPRALGRRRASDGLRADAIPRGRPAARDRDAYDAMRSPRPYRDALTGGGRTRGGRPRGRHAVPPDAGVLLRHALGWLAGA